MESSDPQEKHHVYLLACRSEYDLYVKIGLTSHLAQRLRAIQTGCPHLIVEAFSITSEYREEVVGLERLLHMQLNLYKLRGEWYRGNEKFFAGLTRILRKVNAGGFSYDEVLEMPDFCGPELEIMLHRHDFIFYTVPMSASRKKPAPSPVPLTFTGLSKRLRELAPNNSFKPTPLRGAA